MIIIFNTLRQLEYIWVGENNLKESWENISSQVLSLEMYFVDLSNKIVRQPFLITCLNLQHTDIAVCRYLY